MLAAVVTLVKLRNSSFAIMPLALMLCLPPPAWPADESSLGPGDVVRITVFGHPDLATRAHESQRCAVNTMPGGQDARLCPDARFESPVPNRLVICALSVRRSTYAPQRDGSG